MENPHASSGWQDSSCRGAERAIPDALNQFRDETSSDAQMAPALKFR